MPETASPTYTVLAPGLVGVWVFDPTAADATDSNFLFASARTETIGVDTTETPLLGRVNPLVEYGQVTLLGLELTVFIPFDANHDAAVQYWRDRYTNRRALCYRDNRGRLTWVAIAQPLTVADGRAGTALGIKLRRIDYTEAV